MISGFIPAAGKGTRLRPATLERPKALIPFCGVSLLELAVSRFEELPIDRIIINSFWLADQITDKVKSLTADTRADLRISRENVLLGTGGGIRNALKLLEPTTPILVHNADVILDFDLQALIRHHTENDAVATLLIIPERGPLTVKMDHQNLITDFRRPRNQGDYTFSGVYIMDRSLLDFLPRERSCCIITAFESARDAGLPVSGLAVSKESFWADLGTASSYIQAHGEIHSRSLKHLPLLQNSLETQRKRRNALTSSGVLCTGAIGLGDRIQVPARTRLHNAVLWDRTKLPEPRLFAEGILSLEKPREPDGPCPLDRPSRRALISAGFEPSECTITPMRKRGSRRTYCRIASEDVTCVWAGYDCTLAENCAFVTVAEFLRKLGLSVPKIFSHFPDSGEIVMEDLGTSDLAHLPRSNSAKVLHNVVKQVARLHVFGKHESAKAEIPLQQEFRRELYDWERDYFRRNMLEGVLGKPELWKAAEDDYRTLRLELLEQPPVLIHRDLQSTNVMITDARVCLLDFQGIRLGPATYDLASLLYDPYRDYSDTIRAETWKHYVDEITRLGGDAPKDKLLPVAAVQRLMQALGAYGKLWKSDGLSRYRNFIPRGLKMLRTAALKSGRLPGILHMTEECIARIVSRSLVHPEEERE